MNVLSNMSNPNKNKRLSVRGYSYGKVGQPIKKGFYGTEVYIGDIVEIKFATYDYQGNGADRHRIRIETTNVGPLVKTTHGYIIYGAGAVMCHSSVSLHSSYEYVSHRIIKRHYRVSQGDLNEYRITLEDITAKEKVS